MKIEEVSVLNPNGKYSCNVCGKEYTRNGISTHYWLAHRDGGAHLTKLHQQLHEARKCSKAAWNKGLTADTDYRVAKIRESLRQTLASSEFVKTRVGVPLRAETKEKLSAARSRFLNEQGNGGFKNVLWYKSVDSFGNACSLRGTWEVKVADWLTAQSVSWTRRHYITYLDGDVRRTYAPDFYVPADNVVIEVKGYYSAKDKTKMSLVAEQHPDVRIKFVMKRHIKLLPDLTYASL